ncbi:DNA polymerase subunit beta [Modestobacter sp. I12A-02628]|uniref:Nucleotidyltransferase domain-containing protein n=1 Tax=Goekera deserti TaxID=2497753 RepID=A0A7K3WJ97_9ACTN|nr:nucleotidyltransferase domain-containing protein [Goekera deserti]MPQ98196.1 DNA polymerase subunit beta [Goekera deserti]NDI48846.1 DNA polymerase subunit beta [Goekera deserti]NEL56527.1 nucleotidyltransferase domain-containing protein [Goekera deserti]
MLDDARLLDIARELTAVRGVVGVLLGGSRARGDATPESDVDLGVYYRGSLDTAALGALARELAGPHAMVTEPGDWGPWVDGGAWLHVDGLAVDWIYRDVERVRTSWDDARQGRYRFHAQVGHPLGVPDFAYIGEVALGRVLSDPTGELAALRRQAAEYPPALREALVAGLWEAEFSLRIARKAVSRADATYVAGCLFRLVGLSAHALHGHAGRWLVNEKGAVASAARLPGVPADLGRRAHGVLTGLGPLPGDLERAVASAEVLLADVRALCGR